jgi:K+-sensing histidine kinase KdpD
MDMPEGRSSNWLVTRRPLIIGLAVLLPYLACLVLAGFRDSIANTDAALGLVLLIVAAGSTGIRAAGMLTALSSAVWFDFFLTEPFNRFAISKRADIETAALLMLVGVAVTEIALWGRRQQARASREQGYLDGVLRASVAVGAGPASSDALIDYVCQQLVEVLRIDRCRFETGAAAALASINNDGTVSYNGHPIDVARRGLPTDTEISLVVPGGGTPGGAFLLTAATGSVRPSPEQLRVAVALANQVSAALRHQQGRPQRFGKWLS